MDKTIRIILADDDEFYVNTLAKNFNHEPDMEVITIASDGATAMAAAAAHLADVILLDVDMPGIDGPSAAKAIQRINPKLPIIILTSFKHPNALDSCLKLGLSGFLTKDTLPQQLAEQIRLALTGQIVLGPTPTKIITASYLASKQGRDKFPEFATAVDNLPPRLRQVFEDVILAYNNKEIAERQGLSEVTVRGYVKDLMAATHMHSRGKLILTAAKAGYVHDGK